MKKDTDLRRDVLDELEWEPSIDAAEIGVAAHGGVVTLTGTAKTFTEKLAAEQATLRVQGVKAVANDIDVRLPGTHERSDADIARAAVDALHWRSTVPSGRVKVSVSKGWTTLEGEVDWHYQKDAAFRAVNHLVGVKGVTNLITVKAHASATEVKSRIESAFRRSAELDAERVRVETQNGKVILRGNVSSYAERQEAERTAWAAPGVTQVENLIAIAP
jgi:osmotically-inducible protein OsmY